MQINNIQPPEILISFKGGQRLKQKLSNPKQIYEIAIKLFDSNTIEWTEEIVLLCLNSQNQILGYFKVSSGGFSRTIVDPKVIFTIALNCAASKIILIHNHPTGNLKPSTSDIQITKRLGEGAEILGMNLIDHLIVSNEGFYSFQEYGML